MEVLLILFTVIIFIITVLFICEAAKELKKTAIVSIQKFKEHLRGIYKI